MPDSMMNCFADADHHGAGRAQPKAVCFAMDHEPIIGFALERADIRADFVVENFAAAPWHGVETGGFQPRKNLRYRDLWNFGNIQNLRWRKTVAVNLKAFFDSRQEPLVVI